MIRVLSILIFVGANAAHADPTLRFTTHFENSYVVDDSKLPVTDSYLGSDIWGKDLSFATGAPTEWGKNQRLNEDPRLGNFGFNLDTTGNGAHISIIDDPTRSGQGKVMRFYLQYGSSIKGRVQTNVYGNAVDMNEVTSVVKMYIHPDMAVLKNMPEAIDWLTIQELWTNAVWGAKGENFRMTLGLAKKSGSGQELYFQLHADEAGTGGETFWSCQTTPGYSKTTNPANLNCNPTGTKVPIGEWFTLTTYYKKGVQTTGRLKAKITLADGTVQPLFDLTGWTMHPTDVSRQTGLTQHNPHKMYTNLTIVDYVRTHTPSQAMIIYWDDWRYFEGDAYAGTSSVVKLNAPARLTVK